jgi:hypothetical protein
MEFPVVWINKSENNLGVFLDQDQLTSCAPGSQSFFTDLIVCSYNGIFYQIRQANKVGKAKRHLPGLPKFFTWLGLGMIRVEHSYYPDTLSLSFWEFKDMVIHIIKDNEELWDSDGEIDTLLVNLWACENFQDLIMVLRRRCWPDF